MSGDRLDDRLAALPDRPGVYLFRGANGEILYVGKASSLRSRVRSYFGSQTGRSFKIRELARRTVDVDTFVVESPAEALLLESNLIKEHKPRFNIQLRDDKTFPYVKVTVHEPFPRVLVTRQLVRDGSRYFGPFTDVGAMRRALRMIRQTFDVRSCHYDLPREAPDRPCLDYFIERCKAPCVGRQTEEDYRKMIDRILEILSGHTGKLKREVGEAMEEAAQRLDFERAAELRDVLRGLASLERRKTTIDARGGNRDVLGIARSGRRASALFLRVREGKLLGRDVHYLEIGEGEEEGAEEEDLPALTARVLASAYLGREDLPPELLVPADFEDRELIEAMVAESRDGAFRIRVPRRGTGRRLMELAEENAAHLLVERAELARGEGREAGTHVASLELAGALGLDTPPKDIVCFDISTLGGTDSVGAAVWLRDGRPWKKEYRRFRIRLTEEGQLDDFSMMQEVVGRYFARRVEKGEDMPDLVLIDGGKGQLGAARHAMERSGVSDLPVAALAKRLEEVFLPGKRDPVSLDPRGAGLRWLKRARDEAHRFSVDYHRKLRKKRTLRSALADVPGVGPRREQDLLRRFGSARAIREAAPEDLMAVRGIGRATARRILDSLQESEP